MDKNPHLAEVRVVGSSPVFRSNKIPRQGHNGAGLAIIRGEEFADLWGLHPVELRRPIRPTLRSPQASSSERQSPHAIRHQARRRVPQLFLAGSHQHHSHSQ